MELFVERAPREAENFRLLATGAADADSARRDRRLPSHQHVHASAPLPCAARRRARRVCAHRPRTASGGRGGAAHRSGRGTRACVRRRSARRAPFRRCPLRARRAWRARSGQPFAARPGRVAELRDAHVRARQRQLRHFPGALPRLSPALRLRGSLSRTTRAPQFTLTLGRVPSRDCASPRPALVFGRLLRGYGLLRHLEALPTNHTGEPIATVRAPRVRVRLLRHISLFAFLGEDHGFRRTPAGR